MKKTDNSGPAFPIREDYNEREDRYVQFACDGLSIRDYMAIHASEGDINRVLEYNMTTRQQARYMHADAMLAERDK